MSLIMQVGLRITLVVFFIQIKVNIMHITLHNFLSFKMHFIENMHNCYGCLTLIFST